MHPARFIFSIVFAGIIAAAPPVRAAFPTVAIKAVCLGQIHSPTTITYAPDGSGRLFVCDQIGKIYIIQNGMMLPTPFLDITSLAVSQTTSYSERGLLGLAFHPGYANPLSPGYRKFYLNYVKPYVAGVDPPPPVADHTPNAVTVIAEFQVSAGDPNVAVLASERRMLLFTQPQSNHNGGQIEFGPDGFLYIGCGDGGSQQDNNVGHTGGSAARPTDNLGNAQDRRVLLGKILRIDVLGTDGPGGQYGIPAGNPFVGQSQSISGHPEYDGPMRGEIYSFGMRNPWRFSFDKRAGGTNRLFCGDVGGDRIEEVNIIVSGGNYGWRYKEGFELPSFSSGAATNPMPNYVGGTIIDPIAMYAHTSVVTSPVLPQLGLSVTGGFVYRGAAIPAMQGKYVLGDYGSTSTTTVWDSRLMGLEETSPGSGVFTLTQALPLAGIPLAASGAIAGQRILGLGEDESGEIYIGMKTKAGVLQLDNGLPSGGIYKIVPLQSVTTTLPATKDNTIFSDDLDATLNALRGYSFSSDALGYLYAGKTGPNRGPYLRRALLAFDIAGQVPAGAVIQSAQLSLYQNKAGPGAAGTSMALHRLTQTWGEGTSLNVTGGYGAQATTNDATWQRRFYNTSSWSTVGGTYIFTASATKLVSSGLMTWDSATQPTLKTDVQGWLDTPANNAGWILRGDEATNETACRFDSKDAPQFGGTPPALQISYSAAPPLTRRESWLRQYFLVGKFVDDLTDLDGDSIVNLIEYAYGYSPLAANPPGAGLHVSSAEVGPDTVVTITFRRDPRAVDLTYILETSSDLTGAWTNITESDAGAAPIGTGFISESDIAGETPMKLVTAQETLPTPAKRFARLRIVRTP